MDDIVCIVCKSRSIIKENDDPCIVFCQDCHHRHTMSDDHEIYDTVYFEETHENWFKHPNIELFEHIKRCIPVSASVLDVGCGDGALLKYLREHRFDISLTGIDLKKNVHEGIEFIQGDIMQYRPDTKYDVVICLGTIEHIETVHEFINTLFSSAKDNGTVIIMTIDSDSFIYSIARSLRSFFSSPYRRLYDKAHRNHYSYLSLRTALESKGEIIDHRNHNYPIRAVDTPSDNGLIIGIYIVLVFCIFRISSFLDKQMLQTIMIRKRSSATEHK